MTRLLRGTGLRCEAAICSVPEDGAAIITVGFVAEELLDCMIDVVRHDIAQELVSRDIMGITLVRTLWFTSKHPHDARQAWRLAARATESEWVKSCWEWSVVVGGGWVVVGWVCGLVGGWVGVAGWIY